MMKRLTALLFSGLCLLTSAAPIMADRISTGHNSSYYLQYGSGSTMCFDNTGHYYANMQASQQLAIVGVEIFDPYGNRVDHGESKGGQAWATYQPGQKMTHSHTASSGIYM